VHESAHGPTPSDIAAQANVGFWDIVDVGVRAPGTLIPAI